MTEVSAMDIAKYIINYSNVNDTPVTNLKLQMLLYFLWEEFYKETKEILFRDNFQAANFGPAISEVYYKFCPYGGFPINKKFDIKLPEESLINKIIKKYINRKTYDLVMEVHKEGSPYSIIYNKGTGLKDIIPFSTILNSLKE